MSNGSLSFVSVTDTGANWASTGMVANPSRGQLNREDVFSPVTVRAWRMRSLESGSAVPFRVSPLTLRTQGKSVHGAYSQVPPVAPACRDYDDSRLRRPSIPPCTPSGRSRVYKVAQLCTDGVHRQESAGTGPVVVLKV